MQTSAVIEPGSVLTLTPHDMAIDGGGVARHGECIIFLNAGLPGETVRVRITEKKKRFAKGVVLETLVHSPDETPSHCPAGTLCGGCAWTHCAYPAQLQWKERHVRETFRRLGRVTFESSADASARDTPAIYSPIIASPRPLAYRNKVEFAFGASDNGPELGLRQRSSHAIVPIAGCPLAAFPADTLLETTRAWMRAKHMTIHEGKEGLLRFLVMRCPEHRFAGKPQCVVELITAPARAEEARAIRELGEQMMALQTVTGFVHSERISASAVAYGEKVVFTLGETVIIEDFGSITLKAPIQAFLQVNTLAAALLYERIRELTAATGAQTIWDLYSGVGGIALSLAAPGRTVHGFESVGEAVRWAQANAEQAPGSVSFTHCDVTALPVDMLPLPDLVVLDPPRAGIAAPLLERLLQLRPRHIISISCDPASQARDIALLSSAYRLEVAGALDIFPQTPHIESYALLALRE